MDLAKALMKNRLDRPPVPSTLNHQHRNVPVDSCSAGDLPGKWH